MNQWKSDWTNDPDDDYNLILEILCDDEDVAVIKQSQKGLIIKWYISPNGFVMPVNWLSALLQAGIRDITDPTTVNEEIYINQWTSDWINDSDNNSHSLEILCEDEAVATITQGQEGLALKWHTNPKGLIIPADWFSGLLLSAIARFVK